MRRDAKPGRLRPVVVAMLCALVGGFAFGEPSSALAVMRHEYLSKLTGTPAGTFSDGICGVTVDPATQDVYVSDPLRDAIDIFSSTGKYESQISGMSVPAGAFDRYQACSVAVDDVNHDVYVGSRYEEKQNDIDVVYVFNALGGYVATISGSTTPSGHFLDVPLVAVDQSTGDVYVSAGPRVDRFNPKDEYQAQLTLPVEAKGFAVNASGDVYVSGLNETTKLMGVFEFNGAGGEISAFDETPSGPLEYAGVMAIDGAGEVYVRTVLKGEQDAVDEFAASGAFVDQTLGIPDSPFRASPGLAVNANDDLYIAENEQAEGTSGAVDVFGPSVDVPFVATGGASIVADTAEAVAGTVNPEGVQVTSCEFEYATDSVYRAAVAEKALNPYEKGARQACAQSPGAGSGDVAVSAQLSGLEPSSTYDYRIVASNAKGDEGGLNEGEDATFRTSGPPAIESQTAKQETHTGAVVEADVYSGEHETSVHVEYGESESYGSRTATVTIPAQSAAQSVDFTLGGLAVGSLYHYRFVAENQSSRGTPSRGTDATFQTLPAARIEGESVASVGATGAIVSAEIDDLGTASTYYYEYGPSDEYGLKTPAASLPASEVEIPTSTQLTGLQPASTYSFRVVVENALVSNPPGFIAGVSEQFTTFAEDVGTVPDGRVYEQASQIVTGHNTEVYIPSGMQAELDGDGLDHGLASAHPFAAAPGGAAVAYVGEPPPTGGSGKIGQSAGNELLARRAADGGWSQLDLESGGVEKDYVAFSEDLSLGVLESDEQLAADAPAGYANLFVHATTAAAPFEALIAQAPAERTPADFEARFGGWNTGGSAPYSHRLIEANAVLPSKPAAPEVGEYADDAFETDLYDNVGGRLYLVNVLPDGEAVANAAFGRERGEFNGYETPDISGAISADGSRIFWSALEARPATDGVELAPKALYVRENDTQPQSRLGGEGEHCSEPAKACTVQVDASTLPGTETEKAEKGGGGQFWTASDDGSRVFFSDEKKLTAESNAEAGKPDLYEYDLQAPEGERLSDLSAPAFSRGGAVGEHADVQGLLGTSEDGSYVYFVADGVLSDAKNTEEREPIEGEPNLYLRHEGETTFVATLAAGDGELLSKPFAVGDWQADPGHRTAQVTPDGQSVTFMSTRSLTGYDNVVKAKYDGVSRDVPLSEVFVYDAQSGRLACASCNPSGEPPTDQIDSEFAYALAHGVEGVWGGFLPTSDSLSDYQPRLISDSGGRVFFDSVQPLAPQDGNGLEDVYEWEREGEGSCGLPVGCVYSISGGQSTDNSYLIDASASGEDVFFVSRADLVKADRSEDYVLYDARVDGVEAPEAGCSGTGCQGVPPPPPTFATPPSVTFSGLGNLPSPPPEAKTTTKKRARKCERTKKLSHGKCVKRTKAKGSRGKRGAKAGGAGGKNGANAGGAGGKRGAKAGKSGRRAHNHESGK